MADSVAEFFFFVSGGGVRKAARMPAHGIDLENTGC